MLSLIISYFTRRRDEDDERADQKKDEKVRRRLGWRLTSIVATAVAIVLFILTEDMSLPMDYVDGYTLWHAVIAVAQVVVAILSRKKYEDRVSE
jgi:amino acid transporter